MHYREVLEVCITLFLRKKIRIYCLHGNVFWSFHLYEYWQDGGNQILSTPKECKEALSFSNRNRAGSPFALAHSSSGSRVLSEESESGLDCAFYPGERSFSLGFLFICLFFILSIFKSYNLRWKY